MVAFGNRGIGVSGGAPMLSASSGGTITFARRAVIVLTVLLGLVGLSRPAQAEVTSLRAEASPVSLQIGETLVYQVVVTGSGTLPTPRNNIPDAFQILSGPNSNFSMQIVNGRMSSTRTLSYTLRALRRGEHTIPAPVVRDGGKDIRGNAIRVQVAGPNTEPKPAPEAQSTPGAPDKPLTGRDLPPMFLRATVNKSEVVLQEPVVVTFTLYFQPQVQTYDVQRLPSTEGFWTEEWPVPDPPPVVERNIGGSLYKAAEIHRLILYPTRTGELTIGPMEVMLQYLQSRRTRDFFDSFFRQTHETRQVSSDPIVLTVNPLPEEGKPEDFANVVGDWRIRATMDADTVETNESVTLSVTIEGRGNVGFLPAPELQVPPDIELYEPEVSVDKNPGGGQVRGRKTFTWLLIPRRAGEQRIAPVPFSFYDPEAGRYRTLQADPGTLVVRAGASWTVEDDGSGAPAPVASVGRDIRWIKDTAPTLVRPRPPLHQRASYWSLYAIPVLVMAGGVVLRRRRDALAGQESLQRSRKAARRAMVALREARDELAAGQVSRGYDALARGMVSYLADRLNLPAASLDSRTRERTLRELGLSDATRADLESLMQFCDSARFTPQGSDANQLEDAIERARRWISGADKYLRPLA